MTEGEEVKGFTDLPKWAQLLIVIAAAILVILLGLLAIVMPIYLCFVQGSGWPLLWYCIPAGIVAGFSFYFEVVDPE